MVMTVIEKGVCSIYRKKDDRGCNVVFLPHSLGFSFVSMTQNQPVDWFFRRF